MRLDSRKLRRQGNLFWLPMFLAMIILPWILFLFAWAKYVHAIRPEAAVPFLVQIAALCLAALLTAVLMVVFVKYTFLIAYAEDLSCRVGLGESQIWTGATRREKICRELARALLFLVSGAAATWLAFSLLPGDLTLRWAGAAAFWQPMVVMIFLLLVYPLKSVFPRFGGFGVPPNLSK